MQSVAAGLFFEESSSGMPTLKKTPKMTFQRWSEYNNALSDRIESMEERKAYRAYTGHLVTFREQGVSWDLILVADTETREMVKTGELDGFGDPRVLARLLTQFRDAESGSGGSGGGGGSRKRLKNVDWKKLGLCKFWNLNGKCKKGSDCDFKHEKPPK